MMSRKRMLSGKRILAGVLTAVMVVSSAQLPMGAVYAEEVTESAQEEDGSKASQPADDIQADSPETDNSETVDSGENEGGDAEDPSQSDDTADGDAEDPSQKDDTADEEDPADGETEEPSDGEDISDADAQEPSDEEEPAEDDDAANEEGEGGIEESDTGELRAAGISDNDLIETDVQETVAEDELEGAYQFGGAPSKRGSLSVYAVSVLSNGAEEYLYQQILARNTMIDISKYNIPYDSSGKTMVRSMVSGVLNEHPDLYFVERGYSYWNNGTIITAISLTYKNTYDDAAFRKGVTAALSRVNSQMSDLEKAVVLHDYLTINCEYDYQNYLDGTILPDSYNAYGILVDQIAVCQGYALAYKYLLNQVGIDCYMVTSDSMNHAWNMIVLDGKYYQVDVTWDDPTWDKVGRSVHTYMFRSDAAFTKHQDWVVTHGSEVVDYQATDTSYDNAFWTECKSPLVLAGDDCYYISSGGSINKTNLSEITNKGTAVLNIGTWPVWGGGGNWVGSFSGLFRIGDRIYYNDKSCIYSIAMDGTDRRTEFTADTTTGYIYGSAYRQGKVVYVLHKDANETGKEEVLTADIAVEGGEPTDIPVESIELSAYTLELTEGEEADLTATVYPTFATDSAVIWTSGDETVAEVTNGKVRAVSAGTCTVTAAAGGQKAECSVQVTAKEDNGALDLGNLSYEYTALDDTKITSAAEGRPKLLIFYSNTCGNCRGTIMNLSSSIDSFAGIDVYAIETTQKTKEEVAAYQKEYGCEEITFSYDTSMRNANSMWAYTRAAGIEDDKVKWPVICYIDAYNRLQYITVSWIAAEDILSNVKLYTGWTPSASIRRPAKTTYKIGQHLDVTGGKVTYPSGGKMVTINMKADMVSGFDSSEPGVCTVTVAYGGYTAEFDVLIVKEPALTASYGQKLKELVLPSNGYGTYSWAAETDTEQELGQVGEQTYAAVFTPNDTVKFQKLTDLQIKVTTKRTLDGAFDVTFINKSFTYSGIAQEPKVVVSAAGSASTDGAEIVLTEGLDYELSYVNNRDAGTATVVVTGVNVYQGSIAKDFEIKPAQLVITAQDMSILTGDPVPAAHAYEYEISGLMADDVLLTEPSFSCGIADTTVAGRYDIIPYGADAGTNYSISYRNGRLNVASEYVSCAVSFDVQGHGTAPADMFDVKAGSTINRPADPAAEGYRFDGWYRDAACTKAWNFEADIVHADMTLYAKWLDISENSEFALQEIADVYYTGKACKPAVSVYDGDTLLKSGRDYQIKYYNNTDANKDGVLKQGNGEGIYFNAELPYAEIIGKGNYTDRIKDGSKDTVKVNFNILRTSIGDGSSQAADGIVLKISDQLATAKNAQKPFTSIKYVKGMKRDVDFKVRLAVENARDQAGRSLQKDEELPDAVIPAGYSGEFLLTVEGIGNYEGSICREIYVTDKAHLIKNATITIGKNQKNVTFTGRPVRLNPAEVSTADNFIVKYGKTILKPGRDYTVSYRNHDRVGKAELIITGMGEYAGSKTASFNIKGRSFTAKNVLTEGIENKVYTGRAITQNGVRLTYGTEDEERQPLRYGTDYTISYSKNINKGTATMTFKGVADAGYSGSFKKTFKITAADIAQTHRSETMQNMVFSYCKASVKPVDEILLTNQEGFTLRNGKDYTLKYVNNKAVASASAEKPPTVIVKGKGNYAGEFNLYFDIVRTDLRADSIQIKTTPTAYKENKAPDYAYKPAVKLMDGKSALRAGKDYVIEYRNHTQADYENYIQNLRNPAGTEGNMLKAGELTVDDGAPIAVITEAEGSAYKLEQPIIVPLPVYINKLSKTTLKVYVDEAVYSGGQVTPKVTVFYGGGLIREGEDYTLSYGKNTVSGKNKGSVVISGIAPYYGGSVTVKFDIVKKPITY